MRHTGGHKYCPYCREITETRVLAPGYKQLMYRGVPVKRRQIICGRNRYGDEGCGGTWYTYEIPETVLGDAFSKPGSLSEPKRGRKGERQKA